MFSSDRTNQQGFSLVEMVIAAALMVIATIGTVALFNYSISQNSSSRNQQEEQSAISEDVAAIQVANDRYSCSDSDASVPISCSVSGSDPGEDSYYTAGTAPSASFNDACLDGSLIDNLLTAINAINQPAAFSRLGISRTAAKTPSSDGIYHRYTVTWSSSGGTRLRQITLVPTVAGWCP